MYPDTFIRDGSHSCLLRTFDIDLSYQINPAIRTSQKHLGSITPSSPTSHLGLKLNLTVFLQLH